MKPWTKGGIRWLKLRTTLTKIELKRTFIRMEPKWCYKDLQTLRRKLDVGIFLELSYPKDLMAIPILSMLTAENLFGVSFI